MSLYLQLAITLIVPAVWGWGMYWLIHWVWPVSSKKNSETVAKKLPDYHI